MFLCFSLAALLVPLCYSGYNFQPKNLDTRLNTSYFCLRGGTAVLLYIGGSVEHLCYSRQGTCLSTSLSAP